MAKIMARPDLKVTATFELNEAELRALDAMVGYGPEVFLDVFKAHLGKSYMSGNEEGLREFFNTVRGPISSILGRIKIARQTFG